MALLDVPITPNFDGLLRCICRQGAPDRAYNIELFVDPEVLAAAAERFGIGRDLNHNDPFYALRREIAIQRFLGYDTFRVRLAGFDFPLRWDAAADTTQQAGQQRASREWVEEHKGPIQSWADFERYPWPSVKNLDLRPLEWLEKNLPDDMRVHELTAHVLENVSWTLGYETLCYMVHEDPDLVEAISARIGELYLEHARVLCQFRCVGVIWGSDDMGFKTQPLLSPEMLRRWILPWHKKTAELAHAHGKPYLLHACGNLESFMEDLIDDVKIDAKHSYEDAILPVTEAFRRYGRRIGILGGIDMDFLCRADESSIRRRVRQTLEECHAQGGYCLGTGNTVANYMPLENYLVMLDEGRRFTRA